MLTDVSDAIPTDLRDLRYVQHFSLWAIRTSVACSPHCRTLLREFNRAFAGRFDQGVAAYHALVRDLGGARRKTTIGRPGHIELTHDELSLLALLAAAQNDDRERFLAHARFVMGHNRLDPLCASAGTFTRLLREQGHFFSKPRLDVLQDTAFQANLSALG